MEFTAIQTQEEFDKAIASRLERQKETLSKQYDDYEELKKENQTLKSTVENLSGELEKTKGYSTQIEALTGKVKDYEINALKTKHAIQAGVPFKFANRITGTTEDEIKADAESLAEVFSNGPASPPMKNPESKDVNDEDALYKKMVKALDKEGE